MKSSLFTRILLSMLALMSFYYAMFYYASTQSYLETIVKNTATELRLLNYVILSEANIDDDGLSMPEEVREPRFETFESGIYGYISDINGNILWSSYSAHSLDIDKNILIPSKIKTGREEYKETDQYYTTHYIVHWEITANQPQHVVFTVLMDNAPIIERYSDFQFSIHRWLIISIVILTATMLLALYWSFTPLRRMANEIADIRSGNKAHISSDYPVEIKNLSSNINTLLEVEKKQRERYHNTLSDLAHSLKTPLAVVKTQIESNSDTPTKEHIIREQTERMEDIIKHQLQRAVFNVSNQHHTSIELKPTVEKITGALQKVYADRDILFNTLIEPNTTFKGDERDLMEVLGNIMDNACKACQTAVEIRAQVSDRKLIIEIHDDGQGIISEQRSEIIKRGNRLDTRHQGQGIGLDVATDIIHSYEGDLSIDTSHLGGALFRIELPILSIN
ncbi:ATP-binding protein [bacterium]|nr:ATP-binding protein [bacterium]